MSQKTNVGTMRYWVLITGRAGMPTLVDATNKDLGEMPHSFEVIDRGPINQWTGEPHA